MTDILPDLLGHGLAIVFCGTAASAVSAQKRAYYANPGNRFWSALYASGITPRLFHPDQFRELLDLRIGLTDLAKCAFGNDHDLVSADYDPAALNAKVDQYQPEILAFTSKRAYRSWKRVKSNQLVEYGWQVERIGRSRVFVLPSPSGAARRYWNITHWQKLSREFQSFADSRKSAKNAGIP